jgi:hypothetical protein
LGLAIYLATAVLFATWITAHVLLLLRLAPVIRVRALVGLLVLPLAPYYALRAGLRRHAYLWIASAVLYLATLGVALLG